MLELVLILAVLVGVPALAFVVVAGSAAYVRAGAERELAAMADEAERADGAGEASRQADRRPETGATDSDSKPE